MDVWFHRGRGRPYFALACRDDGVLVRLNGGSYDRGDPPLPHDLAHFVVEDELQLTAGVWGVLAAGGLFDQSSVVAGRQRPHAAERGSEVIKRAGNRLTQAEVLVRVLCSIARAGTERDPAAVDRIPVRWRPRDLSTEQLHRACERLREAAWQWSEVAEGAALEVAWTVPADATLAGPQRGARRKQRSHSRSRR